MAEDMIERAAVLTFAEGADFEDWLCGVIGRAYCEGYADAVTDERQPAAAKHVSFDTTSMGDGLLTYRGDALGKERAAFKTLAQGETK